MAHTPCTATQQNPALKQDGRTVHSRERTIAPSAFDPIRRWADGSVNLVYTHGTDIMPQPADDPAGRTYRLLVIDDERSICDVVAAIGRSADWSVQAVTDPLAARDTARAFNPDAIVLDIVMPGMDGIQVVRQLAEDRCSADILLLSGFDPLYVDSARMLGECFGLLNITTARKPVALAAVLAFLNGVKARREPRAPGTPAA